MTKASASEERILILSPRGRDAEVVAQVVSHDGVNTEAVLDFNAMLIKIAEGAGAAIISVEALANQDLGIFADWLAAQEPWSDFPIVALLSRRLGCGDTHLRATLVKLGNVVILERPLSVETLKSAADSALRARRRQYAARETFAGKLAASNELATLNSTLEAKVRERTEALALANDQITAQSMERERTNQALANLQKMDALGRLTGGVAHDFNNVLSVIQNSAELLSLISADEKVRTRAGTIKAACQRGSKLTAQLLSFARDQKLELRPVGVSKLFATVSDLAKPLLGNGIDLIAEVGEGAELVLGDSTQLEMALLNLAINARDAMDGRGRVSMRSSLAEPLNGTLPGSVYVRIEVEDDGPGMPSEVVAKAFEPFFTTKAIGKGTGLGLSQVYGMAQQSGGAAFMRSVEGKGTTVEIWMQLSVESVSFEPAAPNSRESIAGLRILVVEDDEAVRAGIVDALSSLGCQVSEAASGEQGLAALGDGRPDLLLTDYLMPGMTGAQLAKHALEILPGLPVLVATGHADMTAIEAAVGIGALLRKPFKLDDLARAIYMAISR